MYTDTPFFKWNISDENSNNPRIDITKSGAYYLDVTISGCTKRSRTVNIKVVPDIPDISLLNGEKTFCFEDSKPFVLVTKYDSSISYSWYKNDTIIKQANQSSLEVFTPAKYTVKLVQGKCSASKDVYVQNKSKLYLSASIFQVCEGDTVSLSASLNSGYLSQINWNNNINNNQKFVPKETKMYKAKALDYYGCKYEDSIKIIVNKQPNLIALANKSKVCKGENVILTGSGAEYYVWDNNVINGVTFTPSETKTYLLKGFKNGCIDTTTVKVEVLALPVVYAKVSNSVVCFGQESMLTGFGASTYNWNNNVLNGVPFKPNDSKTYTVIGTDSNGCTSTFSQDVKVFPIPEVLVVSSEISNTACHGVGLTLSTVNKGSYLWSTGETNSSIKASNSGVYSLKLKDENGCEVVSNSIKVKINPLPVISITSYGPLTFCSNHLTELIATTGVSYLWSDGSISKILKPKMSGKYWVKVTDVNGCSNTAEPISITVNDCAGIEELGFNLVKVYPNPTSNQLSIEVPLDFVSLNFKVMDVAGKEILKGKLNTISNSIDVQTITSGVYFFEIENGYRMKFVKE